MNNVVADASAVIALLMGEPFERADPSILSEASLSAVNLAEIMTRLSDFGVPEETAKASIAELNFRVVPFDAAQAHTAARLRASTRRAGLSLGDRACLALGRSLGFPAITADRVWANLDLGIEIILIR